jgi:hypothetical protein
MSPRCVKSLTVPQTGGRKDSDRKLLIFIGFIGDLSGRGWGTSRVASSPIVVDARATASLSPLTAPRLLQRLGSGLSSCQSACCRSEWVDLSQCPT